MVRYKNKSLINNYRRLETEGRTTFSVLVDQNSIKTGKQKRFVYTYLVPDKSGNMNEVVEVVDKETNKRLRVGDTVLTKSMTTALFGRNIIVSKIVGNSAKKIKENFLHKLSVFGIFYSGAIGIIGLLFRIFKY